MGRMRGANGDWLEGDKEKVDGLVRDIFGAPVVGVAEGRAAWGCNFPMRV